MPKSSNKITVSQWLAMGDSGCYRKALKQGKRISRFPLKKPKGRTGNTIHTDYKKENKNEVDGIKLSQHLEIYREQKKLRAWYRNNIQGAQI